MPRLHHVLILKARLVLSKTIEKAIYSLQSLTAMNIFNKYMKQIFTCVLIIFSLSLSSCVIEEDTTDINLSEALKISAWLLDEELEGTGYWEYDATVPKYNGYWVSNDGITIDRDDVFALEELELNKPRIMAPIGYVATNLNIKFEFDGIIQVKTEIPNDETIRLKHSLGGSVEQSNNIKTIAPLTVNVCPIGKYTPLGGLILRDTLVDKDYYLDIGCYRLDGTPVIFAKLKLSVIKDEHYPWYDITQGRLYSISEERSRFLSIELVEYEYSDIKKFDEFEKYDALYN